MKKQTQFIKKSSIKDNLGFKYFLIKNMFFKESFNTFIFFKRNNFVKLQIFKGGKAYLKNSHIR